MFLCEGVSVVAHAAIWDVSLGTACALRSVFCGECFLIHIQIARSLSQQICTMTQHLWQVVFWGFFSPLLLSHYSPALPFIT